LVVIFEQTFRYTNYPDEQTFWREIELIAIALDDGVGDNNLAGIEAVIF
jgi:hypothetical protein